ncbi:MAG TPA: leishmanolysin-related zinc metalloendopeptidase [Anaeromyxobacter sp.]
MKASRAPSSLACLVLGATLVACGGAPAEPAPAASIVVPSVAGARTVPGGRLSFQGACAGAQAPVTHAWDFPGGDPSASTSAEGVVRFPDAGSFTIGYRCTGADGKASSAARTVSVAPAGASDLHVSPMYLSTLAESALGPALDAAVAVLTSVVTGPVPGFETVEDPWVDCGNTTIVAHVGEVRVLVGVEPLDGKGGIVALSSPCWVRSSDDLPFIGFVKVDSADLASLTAAQRETVLLHELLHVLGFGTLWSQPGMPLLVGGSGTSDPYFIGASARASFRDFDGGAGYSGNPVPLEAIGLAASTGKHWRGTTFGSELMTAYLGASSPLSRTTLEALVDLGWHVAPEAAPVDPLGGPQDLAADPAGRAPRRPAARSSSTSELTPMMDSKALALRSG